MKKNLDFLNKNKIVVLYCVLYTFFTVSMSLFAASVAKSATETNPAGTLTVIRLVVSFALIVAGVLFAIFKKPRLAFSSALIYVVFNYFVTVYSTSESFEVGLNSFGIIIIVVLLLAVCMSFVENEKIKIPMILVVTISILIIGYLNITNFASVLDKRTQLIINYGNFLNKETLVPYNMLGCFYLFDLLGLLTFFTINLLSLKKD